MKYNYLKILLNIIWAISPARRAICALMVWSSSEKALYAIYPEGKRLWFGYLLSGGALWKLGTFQVAEQLREGPSQM